MNKRPYITHDELGYEEHRFYDSSTVSNKFAVGKRIEWINMLFEGNNNTIIREYHCGIIKRITTYTVLINVELSNGQTKEKRFPKSFLAQRCDWKLSDTIKASMGILEKPQKIDTKSYVVYTLSDPRNELVRYVGISKNVARRFKEHLACMGLNFQKNIWVQELLQQSLQPTLTILERDLTGLETARVRENYWIQHYQQGNAPLTNIADIDEAE